MQVAVPEHLRSTLERSSGARRSACHHSFLLRRRHGKKKAGHSTGVGRNREYIREEENTVKRLCPARPCVRNQCEVTRARVRTELRKQGSHFPSNPRAQCFRRNACTAEPCILPCPAAAMQDAAARCVAPRPSKKTRQGRDPSRDWRFGRGRTHAHEKSAAQPRGKRRDRKRKTTRSCSCCKRDARYLRRSRVDGGIWRGDEERRRASRRRLCWPWPWPRWRAAAFVPHCRQPAGARLDFASRSLVYTAFVQVSLTSRHK